jgi:hypothetical protein
MCALFDCDTVKRRLPLPPSWATAEEYFENVRVPSVILNVAGYSTRSPSGETVVGAAAETTLDPRVRAYLELVERVSTVCAIESPQTRITLGSDGSPAAMIAHADLFPESDEPAWRHARSNGIAAHWQRRDACRRAMLELIERDRVLRSWFGQIIPLPVAAPQHLTEAFADSYDLQARLLPQPLGDALAKVVVAVVVGFPRASELPLLRGFGAATTANEALEIAGRECLQQLGFLWGESLPGSDPEATPTAEYHQEAYLLPERHPRLRAWLDGAHGMYSETLPATRAEWIVRFVELTPPSLRGRVHVMKAVSPAALPLTFGRGHPWCLDGLPPAVEVHPIC